MLNQLRTWLRAKVESERARLVLLRVADAVETAVLEIEQTTVEAVRHAAEDGKITAEEAKNIKADAIMSAHFHLGRRGAEELRRLRGDGEVNAVLGKRIEAELARIKRGVLAPARSGG